MHITEDETEALAALSRLAITNDQKKKWTHDLNQVFKHVASLNDLDTDGVEPVFHAMELTQRLADDRVSETDQSQHFQTVAPEDAQGKKLTAAGLYLVPKVVE